MGDSRGERITRFVARYLEMARYLETLRSIEGLLDKHEDR